MRQPPTNAASKILESAGGGVSTSADLLVPGDPGVLEWFAPARPHIDMLLPNEEQLLGMTGAPDLLAACHPVLERGVGATGSMPVLTYSSAVLRLSSR